MITFIIMPLPSGLDTLLGLDYLNANDLWMHPRTRRLVRLPEADVGQITVLAALTDYTAPPEKDTDEQLFVAKEPTFFEKHNSSRNKQNKIPLGLYPLQNSKQEPDNELLVVTSANFKLMQKLQQAGKLNNDWIEKFIAQGCKIAPKQKQETHAPTEDAPDHSGQTFPVRRGGAQAQQLLRQSRARSTSTPTGQPNEDSFLLNITPVSPETFEIVLNEGTIPAHNTAQWIADQHTSSAAAPVCCHMSINKLGPTQTLPTVDPEQASELQLLAATASQSAAAGQDIQNAQKAPSHNRVEIPAAITYPPNFSAEAIDQTVPHRREWVRQLKNQELEKYTCMDPVTEWKTLPTDPLLDIKLKAGAPKLRQKHYKTPVHLLQHLRELINQMERGKFIRRSNAPHSAGSLVIPKPLNPDGTSRGLRLVQDYRDLNEAVEPISHQIPNVSEMMYKLRGSKFISTLDLKNGYWNAGLTERSKRLTAFSTEFGVYEYNVVPQGLVCSAAHFQNWVETKLRKHGVLFEHVSIVGSKPASSNTEIFDKNGRYKGISPHAMASAPDESGYVAVYIDDLIVFSNSEEEHERHLREIMRVCSEENLHLNNAKSKIFCEYTRYLGAVVGNNRIFMDPVKVKSIVDMPTPTSQTELRGFLGAASFYRRWIASYAKVAGPLNDLLKKDIKFGVEWNKHPEKYQGAINSLKTALMSYPILRQPDFHKEFIIYTDASDYAIGAALCQVVEGKPVAIAYVSRALIGPERDYSVQEKECLGIVYACQKFRHYVLGSNFTVRIMTDHNSLRFLTKSKEQGGRIARWAMILSEYNYKVEYLKGKLNVVGDALSRLISRDSAHWRNLGEDDLDTDEKHPFLLLWPDLYLCAMESQHDPADPTHMSADSKLETDPSTNHKWRATEQRMHEPMHDETFEERVLFARFSVGAEEPKILQLKQEHYRSDPDFRDLYKYLSLVPNSGAKNQKLPYYRPLGQKGDQLQNKRKRKPKHDHIMYNFIPRPDQEGYLPDIHGSWGKSRQDWTKQDWFEHGFIERPNPLPTPSRKRKPSNDTLDESASGLSSKEMKQLKSSFNVNQFFIEPSNNLLYYVSPQGLEALCIPDSHIHGESIRYTIFTEMHDSPLYGHRGVTATAAHIRQRYYWPKLIQSVAKFIQSCEGCQNNKIDRQKPQGLLQPVQIHREPGRSYNMDFATDLPPAIKAGQTYDTAWIIVDRVSDTVYAIPCKKTDTAQHKMDLFMDQIVFGQNKGIPLEIISDRDQTFTSKFFEHMCKRLGTSLRLSTARSQATNGKAERKIAVLEEMLRMYSNYAQDNWLEYLPAMLFALNNTPSSKLLDRSPTFFETGVQPIVPLDLAKSLPSSSKRTYDGAPKSVNERLEHIENMRTLVQDRVQQAIQRMATDADERRRVASQLKIGSLVRLKLDGIHLNKFKHRRSKLNPLWYGPFKILEQPSANSYTLELPKDCKIHPTFHVSNIKPATDKCFSKLKTIVLPTDESTDGVYEVEKILDHSYDGRTKQYHFYIKWKGYNELFHSTWEPEQSLRTTAKRILREYKESHSLDSSSEEGSSANKRHKSKA